MKQAQSKALPPNAPASCLANSSDVNISRTSTSAVAKSTARGRLTLLGPGALLCFGLVHCSSSNTDGAGQELVAAAGTAGSAGTAGPPDPVGAGSGAGGGASAGAAGQVAVTAGAAGSAMGGAGAGGAAAAGAAGQAGAAAGAAGAAGAPGTGACDNPNWKFCDDFESYALGTVPDGDFYPYEHNGDLGENPEGASIETVDTKQVSGTKSVQFHINDRGRSFLNTDAPFPMENNQFYGRMMIYLTDVPAGGVHWDILTAYGEGGAENGGTGDYRWGGMNGHTMANYQPGDPAVMIPDSVPPAGQWICYEWRFVGPERGLEMWMDDYEMTGESHRSINPDGWNAPTPFLTVQVGWGHYQPELQGTDVWIDDLVIDDERIGCPPRDTVPTVP